MYKLIFSLACLSFYSLPVQAIELTVATRMAQVAGYKAAFTCSATFNAGKTPAQIAADELSGIRVDYREYFKQLPDAQIHPQEKYVEVKYSELMPPLTALWPCESRTSKIVHTSVILVWPCWSSYTHRSRVSPCM